MYRVAGILVVLGLWSSPAYAACNVSGDPILVAASAAKTDIDACVTASSDGDTIQFTGSASWTSAVTIANKGVMIEGAGAGVSTITSSGSIFVCSGTFSGTCGLGKITVAGTGGDGMISITCSGTCFRLHHIAMGDVSTRPIVITGSYGLIDHMTFTSASNGYNAIKVLGNGEGAGPSGRWSQAMDWTAPQAVYIEDSTWTAAVCLGGQGVFDGYHGSKVVFRHNTVTNQQTYVHGYDSTDEGALQTILTNNVFDMLKPSCGIDRMVFIRGGTGLCQNNTHHLTDAYNEFTPRMCVLYYYRSTEAQQGTVCNGSAGIDGNTGSPAGYPCHQQPGMGSGATGGHDSSPFYACMNSATGNMQSSALMTSESAHVVLNRDYFTATCHPTYVEETYPHPLQTGGAPEPPAAGTSDQFRQRLRGIL